MTAMARKKGLGKFYFFTMVAALILGASGVLLSEAGAQTTAGAGFGVKGVWALLTVANGGGLGKVTSSAAGCVEFNDEQTKCVLSKKISCAGSADTDVCEAYFKTGAKITLTGTPGDAGPCVLWILNDGVTLVWSKTAAVTLAGDATVAVTFFDKTVKGDLSVTVDDPGDTPTCYVNSSPAGIVKCYGDGSGTCDASFDYCTKITLTAAAGKNLFFSGWGTDSGVCAGSATAACSFMLYPDISVGSAAKATKVSVKASASRKSTLVGVKDK
jgi:hypothetical protein